MREIMFQMPKAWQLASLIPYCNSNKLIIEYLELEGTYKNHGV